MLTEESRGTTEIYLCMIRLYNVPVNLNNKNLSYRRDSARQQSLRRSLSFKVTNFDTNQKLICDFLLVNRDGVPLFNILV